MSVTTVGTWQTIDQIEKPDDVDHKDTIYVRKRSIIEDIDTRKDSFGARSKIDSKEIALVKKIDWRMMPVLWIMYFINYLDRTALINGKLNSLVKDLDLKGMQYESCISILFVGYIVGQVPSNMLLNRVRPSWYLPGFMLAWSVVSLCTFLAHDYSTMLACRLLLGITEAPFYPGALYMISRFYTKREMATRISILYTGNVMASAFSGLIAAGVFSGLDSKLGLAGWRWLFIVQGAASCLVSLSAIFILPDSPLKTRWLNAEERELAHDRIFDDVTNRRTDASTVWQGLREACTDPKTWVFCLMDNFHASASGFKNFLPTIMKTLGYGTTETLALTCPPYLFAGIVSMGLSWSSGKHNERTWHATASKIVACTGFASTAATENVAARYVGIMLFVGASGVCNILLAWSAASLGETDEKKVVAIAMTNTFGSVSGVYTPYLWPDPDAPKFTLAFCVSIGFSVGCVAMIWIMRGTLKRQNRIMQTAAPEVKQLYVY